MEDKIPRMYGVGASTMSVNIDGSAVTYVCCHSNGNNNDNMELMHKLRVLKRKDEQRYERTKIQI